MRTTIRLNEELLAEAKQYAAKNRRTLTSVIEDSLRLMLSKAQSTQQAYIEPIVDDGNGLQAGVDLSNNAGLRELMDEWDATA